MKVVVLGAGVIGVVSAYFLARAGHQVIVLDKNESCAAGCSYANGCQLSYSHIETWANRKSLFSIIKASFVPGSFVSSPSLFDGEFWRWFIKFSKNSSSKKSYKNSENLSLLASYSKKALQEILNSEEPIKFEYREDGILHFYRNQKDFDEAIKELDSQDFLSRKAQILNAEECVKKEPTLVKLFDENKLAGGIFYESDASGNVFLFIKALEKICREKYGVVFQYNAEIKNILNNRKKVTGINTSKGVFVANNYVYALGAYGNHLLGGAEVDDPMVYPVKGYSLSIDSDREFIAPNLALTDVENRVVYSRIGNVFRAAGGVEISGLNERMKSGRINFLKKVVKSSFSDYGNLNEVKNWFGFRPFRPNSLPLICKTNKYDNLYLNVGHGSLGWTLSAGSGKILSEMIDGKKDERFSFLEESF